MTSDARRKRPQSPDRNAARGGKPGTAVEKEVKQLVDALDENYSRPKSEGTGNLGGPGNFGGGTLDK